MPQLPETRRLKYEAYIFESRGRFEAALSAYNRLSALADSNPAVRSDALTGLYRCHLCLGNLLECADILAQASVENPDLVSNNSVAELLGRYAVSANKLKMQTIAWPVLFYLANREGYLCSTPERLHDALDDFLSGKTAHRPSDLMASQTELPLQQLVLLLRFICIPEILDSSIWYETQEEVEHERVRICEWLMELDKENRGEYTAEISQLSARSTKRELTHQVGHNKIFVDTAGIEASLTDTFTDRLVRCYSYATLEEGLRNGVTVVVLLSGTGKNVDTFQADEGFRLFTGLVDDLRQRFLYSAEYGLDANLSQRIRHGTLLGELRAQFEASHLLTERQENGEYSENRYWLKRLPHSSSATDRIANILKSLSKGVDATAMEVRNEWIQIKGGRSGKAGMLDFDLVDDELRPLYGRITSLTTAEAFVDSVFTLLWQKTEEALTRIRNAITTTLQEKLARILEVAVNSLQSELSPGAFSDFRDAVTNCRIQLGYSLQNLSEWFRIDHAQRTLPFALSDLLHALGDQVARFCGPTHLKIHVTVNEDRRIEGRLFGAFWDLFFILFDNIAKHAKLDTSDVQVVIEETDEGMSMSVANSLGPTVDRIALREFAENASRASHRSLQAELLATEGRTGLAKLQKILRYDLHCSTQDVVVRISDDDRLEVSVVLRTTGLYYEDSSS